MMQPFQWAEATTVEEALQLLDGGAVIKAGGVDLLDMMKEQLLAPNRLVNIRQVKALDFIEEVDGGLRIGPLVTLARLSEHPTVRRRYRVVADAAGKAATPQIRNMATVGGNLVQRPRCWYFRSEDFHCRKKGGDRCFAHGGENQYHAIFGNASCAIVHPSAMATALVAMGAQIELRRRDGQRQLPLERFFLRPSDNMLRENVLRPDELITAIQIPAPARGTKQAYHKQTEKESFDWPIAEVAAVLEMDGERCQRASIVLGAAAPVPRRAREAEAALAGQAVNEQTAGEAARAAMEDASPMSGNGYKVRLFETVIRRTILAAAAAEADGGAA